MDAKGHGAEGGRGGKREEGGGGRKEEEDKRTTNTEGRRMRVGGEGDSEAGGITHRESTYAHLALLLYQSAALHHVGFSGVGGRASKVLLTLALSFPHTYARTHTLCISINQSIYLSLSQKCRADVKAAPTSARRRVHINARTHRRTGEEGGGRRAPRSW